MSGIEEPELCPRCKRGRVRARLEEIAFQQSTDKGYVQCRTTIAMGVCDACGAKSWDAAAEAAIEEAVRQAYDRL
jgi:hypothetical protein